MPASTITPQKNRIMTGPGALLWAPLGTLLPGQTSVTVTNRAVASGTATLTTGSAHGLTVGKKVIISIGDPILDGLQTTITGTTASTITFATTSPDVTSGSVSGTAVTWDAGGTVAGGVFTDAWPTGWIPVGVTTEGSEFTWTPSVGGVEVAEYVLPVKYVTEGVESTVAFAIAEFTSKNFARALNGGTSRTVSGTGATLLTETTPPELSAETRIQIGWQSDDLTQRRVYRQCFQGGDVSITHRKGTDLAAIGVEFSLEQPAFGEPFRQFDAGTAAVGI